MRRQMMAICAVMGALIGAFIGTGTNGAAQQPAGAADVVVWNAKVLTVDAGFSRAQAVAIRDGVFSAVGTNDEVKKLIGASTRVIDAQGKTVVPGLIETHVHATGAARGEATQPFVQLHSIGEIQDWVRARAKEAPAGGWIQLPRVDVTRIKEGRIPTRADLDAAAPNHPAVFTWDYGGLTQVQVLNSAAIKAAGLTKETRAPEGTKIHLGADGELTGVVDNGRAFLNKVIPQRTVSEAEYLQSLAKLMGRYNEVGITSISERSSGPDGYRNYQQLKSDGRLPVRVNVTTRINPDGTVEGRRARAESAAVQVRRRRRLGARRTAQDRRRRRHAVRHVVHALSLPEELVRPLSHHRARLPWQHAARHHPGRPEELDSHRTPPRLADVHARHRRCGGGRGPRRGRSGQRRQPDRQPPLHAHPRVFPDAKTAARAARLGVVVDTQPMWFYKDGDALVRALGKDRIQSFIGLKIWQQAGVTVALNADHMQGFDPVTALNPYHPFLAMYTAITRKTQSGQVIGPDQRVSREDALRMTTINAARLSFDETKKGSIEVGKFGDLAILSDDYLTCPEDRIIAIRSVVTVVGGKVVYERPGASTAR